jgi:hypothetical protein
MKYILAVIAICMLWCCDYQGFYTFKIKNETFHKIEIRFSIDPMYSNEHENKDTVFLITGLEKTIRIIQAPLNSAAHDCLRDHGMTYFRELVFDTYVDSVKIEKQL